MSNGLKSPEPTESSTSHSSWASTRGNKIGVPKERIRELRNLYTPPVRGVVKEVMKKLRMDQSGNEIKNPPQVRQAIQRGAFETAIMLQPQIEDSNHDKLTGLINQNGFKLKLEQKIAESRRKSEQNNKYSIVVIILDSNNLKQVNDTPGHPEGDEYLQNIAKCLIAGSREEDIVARYGGDEFYVLLETNKEGAIKWWERVNEQFTENNIWISAGGAIINPRKVEESIKLADQKQYQAKGKAKVLCLP